MSTLNEILQYTMFAQAGQGLSFDNIRAEPFDPPPQPTERVRDYEAPRLPVWHFEHSGGSPATVRNLTCISRGMGYGRMGVCEEITYQDIKVVTENGETIDLQLDPAFIIQRGYIRNGRIRERQHFLYPLPAETDRSMLTVFGYEFAGGTSSSPSPIPEAALQSPHFMPPAGEVANHIPRVGQGQMLTVVVAPLRVLVCISLVTAKERADFEPGGLLGAGRVWPHVMVIANRPLAETHATIHVKRPARMQMQGGDHSTHAEMNAAIEASFFADNNRRVLLADLPGIRTIGTTFDVPLLSNPSPYWHDLFDSYESGKSSGTIRAIDRMETGGSIHGAIETYHLLKRYEPRTIERVARQGAYDNVHIAPTMRSSARSLAPHDSTPHHLDKIYMAPFCEHDCLHTHWRWARWHTVPHVFGWSGASADSRVVGRPYAVPGATMAPRNQFVDVESTSLSSFKYIARAVGSEDGSGLIPSGTFSIFFHHGMAYSLMLSSPMMTLLDTAIDGLAIATNEPALDQFATAHSSMRYWRLRFGGVGHLGSPSHGIPSGPNEVRERTRVLDRAKILERVPSPAPRPSPEPRNDGPRGAPPDAGAP